MGRQQVLSGTYSLLPHSRQVALTRSHFETTRSPRTAGAARRTAATIVGVALLLVTPSVVRAQKTLPVANHITVATGVVQFDLSGSGTAPMVSLRDDLSFHRDVLVGELGVGLFRPTEDLPTRSTYVIPEVQLQVQRPSGVVHPYIGAGVGVVYGFQQGHPATLSASIGARVLPLGSRVGGRVEFRVREIGRHASASTAEWTAGLSIR